MAIVCDTNNAPEPGGPFPLGTGTEDYEYTRTFLIYAQAKTTQDYLIKEMVVDIMAVNEPDDHGTPKDTATWEEKLRELLEITVPPLPRTPEFRFDSESLKFVAPPGRTPLDFPVYGKTCIILRLVGNFWSYRYTDPATTKRNLGNHYYNLRRHAFLNGTIQDPQPTSDFQCISFFSGEPCDDAINVRHGINLHADLVMMVNGNEERLPIVLDPDIENKGGG